MWSSLHTCNIHETCSIVVTLACKPRLSLLFPLRLEPLFHSYGVDVIFEGHEHAYERMWPVYNETVTGESYNNPKAPVHIISGFAGCNEELGECFVPMKGARGEERGRGMEERRV